MLCSEWNSQPRPEFKLGDETDREPRVGLAFSSLSAAGLAGLDSSSLRALFLLSALMVDITEAGRLPLTLDEPEPYMWSAGGVPIVSEPLDEGEE